MPPQKRNYDSWSTLPLRLAFSNNWYARPLAHTIEATGIIASKFIEMGKRKSIYQGLRGPNRKKPRSMSAEKCSTAPLSAAATIDHYSTRGHSKEYKMGDADDGSIRTPLHVHRAKEPLEFTISPGGAKWCRTWEDPRPLLHKMINPALIVLASGSLADIASASPYQITDVKYFNNFTDINKCRSLLLGAVSTALAANPIGGNTYADLAVPETVAIGDVDHSPFVIHKKQEQHNYRNRSSLSVHLTIEEWMCIRDTTARTIPSLDNDARTTNEILDAAHRTAIANIAWETDGAASASANIPINRPGERYKGAEVNMFWKKMHTTKVHLSPGSMIHYIVSQPKMSLSSAFLTHYDTEGTQYLAGITRAIVTYQHGEMIGSSATSAQSYGPSTIQYTHDNFVVCSNITAVKQKRIETFNTARTGPWDTIAPTAERTVNEETGAADAGVFFV